MKKKTLVLLLVALTLGFAGCIKDRIVLDDTLTVDGLDPSFAAPLLDVRLNMGAIEQSIDDQNFVYSKEDASFAMIYPKELISLNANDFLSPFSVDESFSFTAGINEANALNSAPVGSTLPFSTSGNLALEVSNGEELDSVLIKSGFINVDLSSELPHDTEVLLTIPGLSIGGNVFSEMVNLNFTGTTPIVESSAFDVSGYVLDLTGGGSANSFVVDADLEMTISASNTSVGDELSIELELDPLEFRWVYGDLGQQNEIMRADTQEISLYRDANGGIIHFENPSIEIYFNNSIGASFDFEFSSLFAPENQVATELTGPDLENIPTIAGATFLGEDAETVHVIHNDGTSPPLNGMLDEGPFTLIYNSAIEYVPNVGTGNFMLDTSRISVRADIIMPFYGYADNFTLLDTLPLHLEKELGLDDVDPDDVLNHEDIEKLTLRLVVNNGLPVDMGVQLVLTDSLNNIVDSVFTDQQYGEIFDSGIIDFSLPSSDPNHGKVVQNTIRTTQIVVTQEDLQFWLDNDVRRVIVRAYGNSNMSSEEELIKLYPEYNLGIEVSAKVDTQIDTTE